MAIITTIDDDCIIFFCVRYWLMLRFSYITVDDLLWFGFC